MKLLYANGAAGEHANSWYAATTKSPQHPLLAQDQDCDVCIIGAGFTGLSAAIELRQQGLNVIVLEAHRVGWGASGRNGGQLGSGFNMDQPELENRLGTDAAKHLWNIAEQAKSTVLDLCRQHKIDVEYQPGLISAMHRVRFVKSAHNYSELLKKRYNYNHTEALNKAEINQLIASENYHGGLIDHGAGHLHPLKLALGLAKVARDLGALLYEKSPVTTVQSHPKDGKVIKTSQAEVRAAHVIVACNGYLDGLMPVVQKHVMPINNFIVATKPLGDLADELISGNHGVYDSRFVVNYFRISSDKRLLFGGGESYGYRFPEDIPATVKKPMLKIFPQLADIQIDYAWGGTLAITQTRLPFVREISKNIYSAGGYSGHGVALAVETGCAIGRAIGGDRGTFDQLAQLPAPAFPGGGRLRSLILAAAMSWYATLDRI